jgi:putative salt-induced outer membrane protein
MNKTTFNLFWAILFTAAGICEEGWKTNLGLSYVATSGNTETQTFSGKLASEGEAGPVRCVFKGSYLLTRDDKTEKANKLDVSLRGEKIIVSGLFGFIEAGYLRDRFSGYTYRASVGPGLGYDIIQSEKQQLKGLASFMFYTDKYSVGPVDKESYGSFKAGLQYKWTLQENVQFQWNTDYLMSLKEQEKYFLNTDASVNVAINSRLAIGLSYQVRYQNQIPSEEIKKTDTAFMTSLIINL